MAVCNYRLSGIFRALFIFLLGCVWLTASVGQPPLGRVYPGGDRTTQGAHPRQVNDSPRGRQALARPAGMRESRAEYLYHIGRSYVHQGYYSEGLEALNQSLALRADFGPALTYKGVALRALREPAMAVEQFDAALAIDPQDGIALGERALTYIVLGNEDKARQDLQASSRLRPDMADWFQRQSQWVAANRQFMAQAPEHSAADDELAQAPPQAAAPPDADQIPADSRSSRPVIDWPGLASIVMPVMVFLLTCLVLLVALPLALIIIRILFRVIRSLIRPSPPSRRSRSSFTVQAPAQTVQPQQSTPHAAQRSGASPVRHSPTISTVAHRPFLRRLRPLLIVGGIGAVCLLFFAAPALIQAFRLDADKMVAPRIRPAVLDFRGNVYTHLGTPDIPIEFSDLPKHLIDALRAREDSRFFEHNGVDWIGLGRAVLTDLKHMRFKQGASTLTMQLVEKAYNLDQQGTVNRLRSKLVEWILAHRGEAALVSRLGDKRLAKEAIMVAYLNRVEFGGGTVGVGAASHYYFEKPVSELTLGEACMLVALLRAPTANSPYRNPDNSRQARDLIVEQMLRRGYITADQARQARFFVVENPKRPENQHNGYLVAAITREINALRSQKKLPQNVWDHENLIIESTLDLWAQEILDSELRKVIASFKGDTADDPLLATGMLVDNKTGQVRALVSGQDFTRSQYDLAFSSRRQVASIAKPFVYGAWLEQGGDISATTTNASLTPEEVRALNNWNPRNSSSLKTGEHSLASGLAHSDNNITVRVGLKAGLRRVYDTLYSAGLVSDKSTTGTTWLLGTFESSLANVVSAYTAFPRGGSRAVPYLVQRVSIDGKEVYRGEPASAPLFSARTASQIHQGLRQAMTEGTGRAALRSAGLQANVAGKTGTSQNSADVWWVGYVPDLTLGVRFGRNSNASLGSAAAGGTLAAPAAARVLSRISERYPLENASSSSR